MKIFSGTKSKEFAELVAKSYGIKLGDSSLKVFKDGEMLPSYNESVRGQDVYIVQSTHAPLDNLFELILMADGAKRASARSVTAVVPYFGYARQDKKDEPRVPIGAKVVANLLEAAGVDKIVTMDLHAEQIQGFFNFTVNHLYGSAVFVPYLKELNLDNLIIASPDVGGTKRAKAYANFLNTDMVICYKQRIKDNEVASITVIGDVKGKNVIITDDIIDTGGTLSKAAEMLLRNGAKSVRAVITHPVMSGDAYDIIENSKLTSLVVTDSIPLKKHSDKIKVISVGGLFGNVIKNINDNVSISSSVIFNKSH